MLFNSLRFKFFAFSHVVVLSFGLQVGHAARPTPNYPQIREHRLSNGNPHLDEGIRIVATGLQSLRINRALRFEGLLAQATLAEFGLDQIPRSEYKTVRLETSANLISLYHGQEILFHAQIRSPEIIWWSEDKIAKPNFTETRLGSDVGIILSTGLGTRRFLSIRNARGNRMVLSIGLDVPCVEISKYKKGPLGVVRVFTESDTFCRLTVLSVNTRIQNTLAP